MRHAYVIHDKPETEAATVAGLLDAKFDTKMFASPETLVGAARACPPDLVVAPLGRPEIGGSDLVLALRSDARTSGVPVVLVGEMPVGGPAHPVGAHVHLVTVVTPKTVGAAAANALACAGACNDETARRERHLRIDCEASVNSEPEDPLAAEAFRELLVEATALVSDVLGADFVAVLERTPGGEFVPVAAVGFDLPSSEALRRGDSMATFTIQARRPIVSSDLRAEDRFVAPAYLLEAGVAGAVCAEIGIDSGRAAVIGAYSVAAGAFGEADITFLQLVAELISTAVKGRKLGADLSAHGPHARALLDAATSTILGTADPSRFAADWALGEREDLPVRSTAEAAHALGNLLQVIGGFAVVLGDRIGFQPELEQVARAIERGSSLAGHMHDLGTTEGGMPRRSDTAAVLRLVERSLEGLGDLTVSVRALAGDAAAAIHPDELARSLDALVRNVAATVSGDRNVQVTATHRSFGNQASAAGLSAGTYVVFGIECDRSRGGDRFAGRSPAFDPGIGLAAAQDAIVRAGGSITFARTGAGGAAFTVYVPALGPSPSAVYDERIGSAA